MIVLAAWVANAGTEVAFDETFDVGSGGSLDLKVGDMDVEIETGSSKETRVVVTLSGNLDKARDRFEDIEFQARVKGNTVIVETRERRGWSWGWSSSSRVGMLVTVTVPEKFDVYAQTSDGDVEAGGIKGEIDLKTSDGDVTLRDAGGPSVYIKTSDGDVVVRALEGDDIDLRTSDGDIKAVELKGEQVSMATSDGNVDADGVKATSITARTSDGDVLLVVSGSELSARSSDGDIDVKFEGKMALDLSTSDGDIVIRAPNGVGANVDLKGEYVKLGGKVTLEGEVGKRRVSGILGDGGPKMRARTSDGSVSLRFY
jgi:DUF4097 and DUF4098 domain-containing protein YvlB